MIPQQRQIRQSGFQPRGVYLGVVHRVDVASRTVWVEIPRISPDAHFGPLSVVGPTLPSVNDRVACLFAEERADEIIVVGVFQDANTPTTIPSLYTSDRDDVDDPPVGTLLVEGISNTVIWWDGDSWVGISGATSPIETHTFSIVGDLEVSAGTPRIYFTRSVTILNVIASVGTAPTGATAIFDVNKNGTTIFTTQANRPTIAISGFLDASSIPNTTTIVSGDYLTVDVDQIGSTVAGADAVIQVEFQET